MNQNDGRDEEFTRLWIAGVSRDEMAKLFGYMNPQSVNTRARRLGLKTRKSRECYMRDERMLAEHLSGVPNRVLAKRYGISESHVKKVLCELRVIHGIIRQFQAPKAKPFSAGKAAQEKFFKTYGNDAFAVSRYLEQSGVRA